MDGFTDGLLVQGIDGRRIGTLRGANEDCFWVQTWASEAVCVSMDAVLGVEPTALTLVCPTEGLGRYRYSAAVGTQRCSS